MIVVSVIFSTFIFILNMEMENDHFKFLDETKTKVTVLLVRLMAMSPLLPEYCVPREHLLWTKGLPATTTFTVPISQKQDIAKILKEQGLHDRTDW